MALCVAALLAIQSGCARSNATRCSDGTICPPGKDCVEGRCVSSACGDGSVDLTLGEECDCGDDTLVDGERPPLCTGPNDDRVGHCRSDCTLHCGDGIVNEVEECDGAPPPGLSCLEAGFDAGRLACSDMCTVGGTGGCVHLGWQRLQRLTDENLRAIWGDGPGDIYVVGWRGALLHYDGNSWGAIELQDDDEPFTDRFFSVWGRTADGSLWAGSEDTVLWEQRDDSGWSTQELPTGGFRNDKDLNGIWGAPDQSYSVAVGDLGQLWTFNGQWQSTHQADLPGSDPALDLHAVWGSGPDNVYAVGDDFTILTSSGGPWSVVDAVPAGSPDNPGDGSDDYNAIWGSSANDVYIVGDTARVKRYDGTQWSDVALPAVVTGKALHGVWGTGPDNVFVVGDDGATLHYDGVHWVALRPTLPEHLYGVWGSSSKNTYVVGNSGVIAHHSGMAWAETGFLTNANLNDVWGTGDTNIFAVGNGGLVFHYDGLDWSQCPLYTAQGGTLVADSLRAVWGTSDGNRLFTVGRRGTILDCDVVTEGCTGVPCDAAGCRLLRCRTASCEGGTGSCPVGSLIEFRGVWGVDAPAGAVDAVYVVGELGTLIGFDGQTWSQIDHGLSRQVLNSVWVANNGEMWAVGDYAEEAAMPPPAVVLHRDATGVVSLVTRDSFDQDLHRAWGSGPDDVFIAGKDGQVWHYDGTDWSRTNSGTAQDLHGIAGNPLGERFAVGANGAIVHFDGHDWQPIRSDTFERINAVWAGDRLVVAVGRVGVLEMLVFTGR